MPDSKLINALTALQREDATLLQLYESLSHCFAQLEARVKTLEAEPRRPILKIPAKEH